jgi:hypothetical protein
VTTAYICGHHNDLQGPFVPESKPLDQSCEDMLISNKKLAILVLACTRLLANAASSGSGREKSLGTFEDPSVHARPKFRYWIPDASVNHSIVARDVQAAGEAGAGGLECLGFYLYGGPTANGGVPPPVSWAKYGFGTDEWSMSWCFSHLYF